MNFETWFQSHHADIPPRSTQAVLSLVAEGATVPFIARYRKEQTGNIDEVAIQAIIDGKEKFEQLTKRQAFILEEIERQKKLDPELKERILATFDAAQLEDLYLPYKQKRKSRATLAREAGLEPLADWIWNCGHGTETPQPGQTLELWAFTFRNEEKGFGDANAAIQGAQDILIERLSETRDLRQAVRTQTFEQGAVRTAKAAKAKPNSKFENYFEYREAVQSLSQPQNSHRYLALRRGWMEEELTLSIGAQAAAAKTELGAAGEDPDAEYEALLVRQFEAAACTAPESPGAEALLKAARMALKAHVLPSIENEVHKALKEVADEAAIQVFAENARKLLLASPFGPKAVLGVDPGIRTGCKLAVVDDSGKYVASAVMHLMTDSEKEKAKGLLTEVVKSGGIRAIAIGNGTAGRETEIFVRAVMKDAGLAVPVAMVSESGASVYSASETAREEFPELDVTVRGAISIARRLQDPLAELVKVDPKSIGVGQYQHDVSQPALKRSLDFVVDSCVNSVGVNLNTASYHLLAHVSGIGPSLAKAIVEFRGSNGLFKSRAQLDDVPRFSKKAFEQGAGFLRIPDGENPLDSTGVHPERYPALERLAAELGKPVRELMGEGAAALRKHAELAKELGEFTYEDVIRELEKPGRDPRDEFVPFQYREDIHELKDLKPGMVCPGIVTNVTNFGAFVDIGVHQDGLVHISQLSDRFVKDPREVASPGDRVQIRVLEVNLEKSQISLSMKNISAKGGAAKNAPGATGQPSEGARKPRAARGDRSRGRSGDAGKPAASERAPRAASVRPPSGGKAIAPKQPGAMPPPFKHPAHGSPAHKQPAPKPKTAFNNPFAGLAALRNNLKPR